jgi:hypothetical protein
MDQLLALKLFTYQLRRSEKLLFLQLFTCKMELAAVGGVKRNMDQLLAYKLLTFELGAPAARVGAE